jgi:uncharacterized membrane protein
MPDRLVSATAIALILAASLVACNSSSQKSGAAAKADSAAATPIVVAAPGSSDCPATGLWAPCSVLYRLDRGGIAPRRDSTGAIEEKALSGKSFAVKFGASSRLEVFLYADSLARIADAKKLDRTKLVDAAGTQTIKRERTLIENGNLIGLLTSLNERLRERVSDALTAGAPQPSSPPVVK